ncbi:MAG TPA: ferritin-like domain-containing protein [Solirubrobacteraceae bacterium]|nr:ferritin-like domain-containing protein [Solirubrobacteraceae bacterium]
MTLRRLATRREFAVGGFAAAAAAGAGAAVGAGVLVGPAAADAPVSDGEALSKALEVERLIVLAYRRVLASGALAADIQRAIAPYLGHEVEHASTVASQLTAMGESAPTAPLSLDAAAGLLSKHNIPGSLTDLHSQNDCLRLLVNLESLAEGVYFTALKTLSKPGLQQLAVQIMACEAQHWTALSGLRNPGQYVKAVPWPFVTGSS